MSIWRYMDLAKFVLMLESQALHFARASILEDKFEGAMSIPSVEVRRKLFPDAPEDMLSSAGNRFRDYTYLSCWHMNDHESLAMWKLYQGGEPKGIAVRSSYRRLSESIIDPRPVYLAMVRYIDYESDLIPVGNIFYAFAHKRKSFEFEQEIRGIFLAEPLVTTDDTLDESGWPKSEWAPEGPPVVPISVDLDKLVETVYVSPKASAWFADVVRDVIARYGRSWPMQQHSSIDGDPVY